jgi:hypothetical protein
MSAGYASRRRALHRNRADAEILCRTRRAPASGWVAMGAFDCNSPRWREEIRARMEILASFGPVGE